MAIVDKDITPHLEVVQRLDNILADLTPGTKAYRSAKDCRRVMLGLAFARRGNISVPSTLTKEWCDRMIAKWEFQRSVKVGIAKRLYGQVLGVTMRIVGPADNSMHWTKFPMHIHHDDMTLEQKFWVYRHVDLQANPDRVLKELFTIRPVEFEFDLTVGEDYVEYEPFILNQLPSGCRLRSIDIVDEICNHHIITPRPGKYIVKASFAINESKHLAYLVEKEITLTHIPELRNRHVELID